MPKILFFPLLFSIVFLWTACTKNGAKESAKPSDDPEPSSTYSELSGEDIFKGIFFLQGELATHVDCLKKVKTDYDRQIANLAKQEEATTKIEAIQDSIVESIRSEAPFFFSYFKQSVSSGNPLEVRNAILLASEFLTRSLYNDPNYKPYLLAAKDIVEKIDTKEFTTSKGELDPDLLAKSVDDALKNPTFKNSSETLRNFGMTDDQGQIAACVYVVAYAVAAVSVVGAVNWAVAVNIAGAVNLYAAVNGVQAVNVQNTINISPPQPVGCAGCHGTNPSSFRLDQSVKDRKIKLPIQFPNKECNRYAVVLNTSSEVFVSQLTKMLEGKANKQ